MISQWWSVGPVATYALGTLAFRKSDVLGWATLCVTGMGWFVYAVMTNQVGLWVMGALLASYGYIQVQELVWHRPPGKLDEEDKAQRQE